MEIKEFNLRDTKKELQPFYIGGAWLLVNLASRLNVSGLYEGKPELIRDNLIYRKTKLFGDDLYTVIFTKCSDTVHYLKFYGTTSKTHIKEIMLEAEKINESDPQLNDGRALLEMLML